MSTHKNIDIICVAAVIVSVLLTVLFMKGEAFGLSPVYREEDSIELFTKNDMSSDWDASGATKIALAGDKATVSGIGAYAANGNVYIAFAGRYKISGSLDNGSVIIDADGDDKIWVMLDGADISCSGAPALIIEKAGKVFLTTAEGSENHITASTEPNGQLDGAIYSRDDLTINGTGTLTVTADEKHGIVCNDDLVISGGELIINAAEDAIHANDSVRIREVELSINAGDDGITVSNDNETDFLYIASGTVDILSCYEGLEATYVTIDGGIVCIYPSDDGINATGDNDSYVRINGGTTYIINETGWDADGIDSNKDIEINGGNVFISVNGDKSSNALDYGSENGGICTINGGNIIACGGGNMAEPVSETSEQGFIMKTLDSQEEGTTVGLYDEDGRELISWEVPSAFSLITVSAEGLKTGDVCTLKTDGREEHITVDNSSPAGGMMGMLFGRPERPDGPDKKPDGRFDRPEDFGKRPDGKFEPPEGFGAMPPENGMGGMQRPPEPAEFGGFEPDGRFDAEEAAAENEPERAQPISIAQWRMLAVSGAILLAGLVFASLYKKK